MKFRVKRRHRLKKRDIKSIFENLQISINDKIEYKGMEYIETDRFHGILYKDTIAIVFVDKRPVPTVKGIELLNITVKKVVIDMGAVRFIANGADVMAPGIVNADQTIKSNDLVQVIDERHGKTLATGIALMDGHAMVSTRRGKAVYVVSYIGDMYWRSAH